MAGEEWRGFGKDEDKIGASGVETPEENLVFMSELKLRPPKNAIPSGAEAPYLVGTVTARLKPCPSKPAPCSEYQKDNRKDGFLVRAAGAEDTENQGRS